MHNKVYKPGYSQAWQPLDKCNQLLSALLLLWHVLFMYSFNKKLISLISQNKSYVKAISNHGNSINKKWIMMLISMNYSSKWTMHDAIIKIAIRKWTCYYQINSQHLVIRNTSHLPFSHGHHLVGALILRDMHQTLRIRLHARRNAPRISAGERQRDNYSNKKLSHTDGLYWPAFVSGIARLPLPESK